MRELGLLFIQAVTLHYINLSHPLLAFIILFFCPVGWVCYYLAKIPRFLRIITVLANGTGSFRLFFKLSLYYSLYPPLPLQDRAWSDLSALPFFEQGHSMSGSPFWKLCLSR